MGAGAVGGQQPVQTVVTERDLMNKIMACESCSIQFTIFKRKKMCRDCQRQFCSTCLPREQQKREGRQCQKCRIIISGNFNRQLLEAWKVKDMRCFLDCHNIPTNMCREKHDLIELLLRHYSQASISTSDAEHERMVQQLTERMRHDTTQDPPPQPDVEVDGSETVTQVPEPEGESPVLERVPRMRLENISSIEEVDMLTVRQLKEVLANNFVDYKGCCEKNELIDRVKRLWNEEQRNKVKVEIMRDNAEKCQTTSSGEKDLCKICMDATIDCVLLECGHMITCTLCGKRLAECPVCRQYVVRVVHTFRA